jgi:hypothetical protein
VTLLLLLPALLIEGNGDGDGDGDGNGEGEGSEGIGATPVLTL